VDSQKGFAVSNIFKWVLPALGPWFCLSFGGGSSSSSATTSTTENRDMRVVGGDASQNISANDSEVTVIATDHGAVAGGLQLGTLAVNKTTSTAQTMFSDALRSATETQKITVGAISAANERLALAYQSGQAGDQTSLKYAGFVVVGLAAVMLFRRS
jgi:hypothetical protein